MNTLINERPADLGSGSAKTTNGKSHYKLTTPTNGSNWLIIHRDGRLSVRIGERWERRQCQIDHRERFEGGEPE